MHAFQHALIASRLLACMFCIVYRRHRKMLAASNGQPNNQCVMQLRAQEVFDISGKSSTLRTYPARENAGIGPLRAVSCIYRFRTAAAFRQQWRFSQLLCRHKLVHRQVGRVLNAHSHQRAADQGDVGSNSRLAAKACGSCSLLACDVKGLIVCVMLPSRKPGCGALAPAAAPSASRQCCRTPLYNIAVRSVGTDSATQRCPCQRL